MIKAISTAMSGRTLPGRQTWGGENGFRRYWLLPAMVVVVLSVLTFVLWSMERADERNLAERDANIYRVQFGRRLENLVWDRLRPVARHWRSGRWATREGFLTDADAVRAGQPCMLSMGWIDPGGKCTGWVGSNGVRSRLNEYPAKSPDFAGPMKAASNDLPAMGHVFIDPRFGPCVYGAFAGTPTEIDGPPGADAVIFQLQLQLLNDLQDPAFKSDFALTLSDDGKPFFGLPKTPHVLPTGPGEPVRVLGGHWTLQLTPSDAFFEQHIRRAPYLVFWMWLAGAVLLLAFIFQAFFQRRVDVRRMQHHLLAMERLAETSASIGACVSGGMQVVKRLPESARSVLGSALASIAILEEGGKKLRITATTGVEPSLEGVIFDVDALPTVKKCIETKQLVAVCDLMNDPTPVNQALVKTYRLRSLLQVPLLIGDEAIGILMMGSETPRRFTAEDMRLAELWGAQAAVALANDRLYQQMRQTIAARDHLLAQRDLLFGVSGEISRPGTLEEILQRICDLSPLPLEVDACQVNLTAEDPNVLEVAAITTRFAGDLIGRRFRIETSNARHVLNERRMMVVEDGPSNKSLHPLFRDTLPCGSVVYNPLLSSNGTPIGIIVLMRAKAGPFSKEQLGLAQLFSTRAAAAIENAQLYHQSRRDADTNAMLLRELNHRVKNNLAGIASLLSLDEPDLTPQARQWLDRVIDRIRTMSRTHEMFTGGMHRVHLQELVDQTLRSLTVVKAPSVSLETQIVAGVACLRSDRAVSLAMVLHELCYNALVHGACESGMVLVKAHCDKNKLIIEVIDDGGRAAVDQNGGRGGGLATHSPRLNALGSVQTGLGLNLVRGFVGRELRGTFELAENDLDGMTARVEIPLLDDEIDNSGL